MCLTDVAVSTEIQNHHILEKNCAHYKNVILTHIKNTRRMNPLLTKRTHTGTLQHCM